MQKKAFTLIELIFTIVIIGVLAAVAVPKFSGLSDNAQIAAELATASSVQVALDSCHGEWIINEGTFTCGVDIVSSDDSTNELSTGGYPENDTLGNSVSAPLDRILKNAAGIGWSRSGTEYRGPASDTTKGISNCKENKPCNTKHWEYDDKKGTFTLKNN